MNPYFRLLLDGKDAERVQPALDGRLFAEVAELLVRHLYWWQQDSTGAEAAAYRRAWLLILRELESRGIEADWEGCSTAFS